MNNTNVRTHAFTQATKNKHKHKWYVTASKWTEQEYKMSKSQKTEQYDHKTSTAAHTQRNRVERKRETEELRRQTKTENRTAIPLAAITIIITRHKVICLAAMANTLAWIHETRLLSVCAYKCVCVCRLSAGMVLSLLPMYACYIDCLDFYSSFLAKKYRMCAYTHARMSFQLSCFIHKYISASASVVVSNVRIPKERNEVKLTWLDLTWMTEWIARRSEHKLRVCEHMWLLLYVKQQKKKTKFKTMLDAQRSTLID